MSSLVVPRQRKLPASNLKARVIGVVMLGKQEAVYKGKKFLQEKVFLSFEFPENKTVYGKEKGEVPIIWGREYTYSAYRNAHLLQVLEALYPEPVLPGSEIDIKKIIGKECLAQIKHESKGDKLDINIGTVTKLPTEMDCPKQEHPSVFFDPDEHDPKIFNNLPKFLQKKIKNGKANEIKEAESKEKAVAH